MRIGGRRFVVGIVAAALAAAMSCRTPTQVTLVMSTDLPCASTRGLAITGAAVGQSERNAPSTISYRCEGNGDLGTLVVTPAHEKNGDVAFRLVMGVDGPAEQCRPPDYKGCVVQRRILSFLPNTELELPIRMLLVCKDVPCDESSTCAASGDCVSARIPDPEQCAPPKQCFPVGDSPTQTPGSNDGGPATLPDGAPLPDAGDGSTDASTDAPTDSGKDGMIAIGDGRLCPPESSCANGPCCWNKTTDTGQCSNGNSCPNVNDAVLSCTQKSDCALLGPTYVCCTSAPGFTQASCQEQAMCPYVLCMASADCPGSSPSCQKVSAGMSPPNGVFGTCL